MFTSPESLAGSAPEVNIDRAAVMDLLRIDRPFATVLMNSSENLELF